MCINTLARPPDGRAAIKDFIHDGTAGQFSAILDAVFDGNCSLTIWYGTVLQGAESLKFVWIDCLSMIRTVLQTKISLGSIGSWGGFGWCVKFGPAR